MKKIKEIKVFLEDDKTLENETIVYDDLKDDCALIWGVKGIDFYKKSVDRFDDEEFNNRMILLDTIGKKCKEKNMEPLFIKTTDCLPR